MVPGSVFPVQLWVSLKNKMSPPKFFPSVSARAAESQEVGDHCLRRGSTGSQAPVQAHLSSNTCTGTLPACPPRVSMSSSGPRACPLGRRLTASFQSALILVSSPRQWPVPGLAGGNQLRTWPSCSGSHQSREVGREWVCTERLLCARHLPLGNVYSYLQGREGSPI